jgi:hypothetical protein
MATGLGGIATRGDANNKKTGAYTTDLKRCITKSSAMSAGITLLAAATSYANNQLLPYSLLGTTPTRLIFKLTIDISSESELYNKGPITLVRGNGDLIPLSYARDVEAVEVEHDASRIPLDYPDTHSDELVETNMTLSTIDEVLQVAQDFEEQDQILGAPIKFLGMSLVKDDASTTNLIEDTSTYGPATVSSKKVTYTLYSTNYTSSANGSYTLNYVGASLKNKDGLNPVGYLQRSSSSTTRYHTLTVNGAGTYTFNAYWKVSTPIIPDPSTPTATTWKLYFRVRVNVNLRWHQVRLALTNWKLLDYDGTVCLSGNLPYTYYTAAQMEMDLMHANSTIDDGYNVYVIPLGSYKELGGKGEPAYIAYDTLSANSYTPYNGGALCMANSGIDNAMTNGALNAGADRAIIYSDISNSNRVYVSVYYDVLPGSDFEEPGPIRPIV